MKAAVVTLMACGATLLVLGAVIWAGGDAIVPAHIAVGVVLVATLWTICAIAVRAGVTTGAVAFAAAWGTLVVVFGLVHEELVPGGWHWTIQALHVAISMGAIWWGRRLARLIEQAQRARAPHPVGM